MAPSAQASAVSARAADRYRPTAADLSGADAPREAQQACRLRSVCSSVNGTIGTNTRSIFCAPTCRCRHSKSCSIYQKRWPIEVDNFYVKQHLGLADFRVQSYEATEKWFAVVFLALAFLQWRLNHAPPKERWRSARRCRASTSLRTRAHPAGDGLSGGGAIDRLSSGLATFSVSTNVRQQKNQTRIAVVNAAVRIHIASR